MLSCLALNRRLQPDGRSPVDRVKHDVMVICGGPGRACNQKMAGFSFSLQERCVMLPDVLTSCFASCKHSSVWRDTDLHCSNARNLHVPKILCKPFGVVHQVTHVLAILPPPLGAHAPLQVMSSRLRSKTTPTLAFAPAPAPAPVR